MSQSAGQSRRVGSGQFTVRNPGIETVGPCHPGAKSLRHKHLAAEQKDRHQDFEEDGRKRDVSDTTGRPAPRALPMRFRRLRYGDWPVGER